MSMMTMMAQMNAVAAAAMAMGSMDSSSNQMAMAQAFFPNTPNYTHQTLPLETTNMNLHHNASFDLHQGYGLTTLPTTQHPVHFNNNQPVPQSDGRVAVSATNSNGGKFDSAYVSDTEDDEESFSNSGNGDDETQKGNQNDPRVKLLRNWAHLKMGKKICRVCGDKALGYNFNVVSCESCKAFFRRNALKNKEFRCPFDENCEVTAVSRRFCQKCRLRKCFEVGMKKEWIMSDEARQQKKARIEENKRKRTFSGNKDSESGNSEDNQVTSTSDNAAPYPKKPTGNRPAVQKQDWITKLTNASFSPQDSCQTPPAFNVGSAFSPPDSNKSKNAPSPVAAMQHQVNASPLMSMHNSSKMQTQKISSEQTTGHTSMEPSVPPTISTQMPFIQPAAISETAAPAENFNIHTPSPGGHSSFAYGAGISPQGSMFSNPGTPYSQKKEHPDGSITIPKSVLISLISQCHSTSFHPGLVPAQPPPPVVARAQRFVTDSCADDDLQCICKCTCGARAADGGIGTKTVDKAVGPGPDEEECPMVNDVVAKCKTEDEQDMKHCGTVSQDIEQFTWSPLMEICRRPKNNGVLTALEEWKLQELYAANRIMTDPPDTQEETNLRQIQQVRQLSSNNDDPNKCPSTIHLTDICVRRIIKMCKRIGAFGSLCQDDQIALLKGGCTELMLLRGVMTFIPEKDSWRPVGCKDTLLSLEVLKGVKGNVYEEHRKFLHSFREEWRRSDAIMLTLAAITLFNPRRPNVNHAQAVQMERETYLDLLRHYLDILYGTGTLASSDAFRELILRVEAVGRLNDYAATIFLEVNPRDVEPLLIEIFDLK